MFDLRLGLQLGKSLQEIRSLSYVEYKLWKTFYMLEPFGFEAIEFQVAQILAQMYNIQVDKISKRKRTTFFMRDMRSLLLKAIGKAKREEGIEYTREIIDTGTKKGKKEATDSVVQNFLNMFGGRVKDERKK